VSADALLKRRVMTEGGAGVGTVANVEFEPPGFAFTQLEVSPGLFTANTLIPFAEVVSIGPELIIVSNAVGSAEPAPTDGSVSGQSLLPGRP
jgi:sporulation protein YlmC with PRC-barrel domain